MSSLSKIAAEPVRMLIVGPPKSGKTGSIIPLVNAGYKIRAMNYDTASSWKVLTMKDEKGKPLIDPKLWKNVNVVTLDNKLTMKKRIEPVKGEDAFSRGFDLMDHWVDSEGVDLGNPNDWGPDTIVVCDGMTRHGKLALARAMAMQNKTLGEDLRRCYEQAGIEQEAFFSRLCSEYNNYNVIVIAHLTMIGPRETQKNEADLAKRIKEEVAELIETRYYPSAIGWKLPQHIGGLFPIIVEATTVQRGGKTKRILNTVARDELDLGVPANIPQELPVETGMLTIFDALGVPRPTKGRKDTA